MARPRILQVTAPSGHIHLQFHCFSDLPGAFGQTSLKCIINKIFSDGCFSRAWVCYTPKERARGSANFSSYHRLLRLYPDDKHACPSIHNDNSGSVISYVSGGLSGNDGRSDMRIFYYGKALKEMPFIRESLQ